MAKQTVFIGAICFLVLILAGAMFWGHGVVLRHEASVQPAQRGLVVRLQLTDFALWTEARYTRHPSQADFFSAFQDSPAALDHFPSGSLVYPPFDQDNTFSRSKP